MLLKLELRILLILILDVRIFLYFFFSSTYYCYKFYTGNSLETNILLKLDLRLNNFLIDHNFCIALLKCY